MTVAMLFKSALGRLWMALALVILLSFGVLSYFGGEIYQYAPPVPDEILSISGEVVFTGDQNFTEGRMSGDRSGVRN